jgi:hypothetical protein
MDKKFFRKFLGGLRWVSPWIFLVAAIVSTIVCVGALRQNNLKALELRDEVLTADRENGDVEGALRRLREHIYGHMNTDLSAGGLQQPIQLKFRYERLVAAEQARHSSQYSQVYTEAQAECEKRFPNGLIGSGRIPCITEYVNSRNVREEPVPDSLYKFSFVSPRWTPDVAGWSLVIAAVSAAVFVIRVVLERWVRAELRDL